MPQYHVYGLGNALVDLEFKVTTELLNEFGIEKGVMTLIDEARAVELYEKLQHLEPMRAGGGSAANTMIALQRLGAKGFYSCKVANDEVGEFYHQDLVKAGLTTNLCVQDKKAGATGKCFVLVTDDADRTMNSHLGITETFSVDEIHPEALRDSAYLYIEGYLIASPTGRAAMHEAKKIARDNNVKIAVTLSDVNMIRFFRDEFTELLQDGVDLLFANQAEALELANVDNYLDAQRYLKQFSHQSVITMNKDGALLFDGNFSIHAKAFATNVIDTVGAGDAFAGAFLYGLTHDYCFTECAEIANLAASMVVAKFGPRLEIGHANDVHEHIRRTAIQREKALL